MNKHKLVYIEWHDAFASVSWYTTEELNVWKKGEFIIQQVGWLVEETDKQIILATRYNLADNNDVAQYGHLQKIPKTWIRKRIDLTKYIK